MPRISFEQSLDHCLQELARTGDVEASLRETPRYAERLRPLLEVAQTTLAHYETVPEAPGGLAAGRERFLASAAEQRAMSVCVAPPARPAITRRSAAGWGLFFTRKLTTALVLIVAATVALGSGATWAAGESLPGDFLHPAKLAIEDIRLALSPTPVAKADLALQFVVERSKEMTSLAMTGRRVPPGTAARIERHIASALSQSAQASEQEMVGLLARIAKQTRAQEQNIQHILEQTRGSAEPQDQAVLERAVFACREGAEEAEKGLGDPEGFGHRYRHQQNPPGPAGRGKPTPVDPEESQDRSPGATGGPQATPSLQPTRHEPRATDPPPVTSQASRATPSPTPTFQGPRATDPPPVTPAGPHATPSPTATSQGPRATDPPPVTPAGPQSPPGPQPTPEQSQATIPAQATPQEPQQTPGPPAATSNPQGPGGGQDGGERQTQQSSGQGAAEKSGIAGS